MEPVPTQQIYIIKHVTKNSQWSLHAFLCRTQPFMICDVIVLSICVLETCVTKLLFASTKADFQYFGHIFV